MNLFMLDQIHSMCTVKNEYILSMKLSVTFYTFFSTIFRRRYIQIKINLMYYKLEIITRQDEKNVEQSSP